MLAVFNTRNGKYGYAQKVDDANYTVIIDGKQKDISAKTFKNWYKEVSAEDVQAHTKAPIPEGIVIPETEAPAPELVQTKLELAPDQQEAPAPEEQQEEVPADNVIPFPNAEVNPIQVIVTSKEAKVFSTLEEALKPYEDTFSDVEVKDLAEMTGFSKNQIKGIVGSLVKKGYVTTYEHDSYEMSTNEHINMDLIYVTPEFRGATVVIDEKSGIKAEPKGKKNDDKKDDAPVPIPTPAPSVKAEGNAKARNKAFFTNFLEELNKQVAGFTKAGARDRNYMSFPAGASGIKYKWYYTGDKLVCSLYFFGGSQQVTTQLFNKLQGFKSEIESKLSAYQLDWKAEENEIHRRVFTTFTGSDAELIKQGVKALIQFKEVFTPYIDIITQ